MTEIANQSSFPCQGKASEGLEIFEDALRFLKFFDALLERSTILLLGARAARRGPSARSCFLVTPTAAVVQPWLCAVAGYTGQIILTLALVSK